MIHAPDLSLTVVFDNHEHLDGLETSWGFGCVVRGAARTILFDTGSDGAILMRNMDRLSVDPLEIDMVVLSHVHWDHTGGLGAFLERNPDVTVFVPRSFPDAFATNVVARGAGVVEVEGPMEICDSVFSTGEMGTTIVEQSLVLRTDQGLVIVTGCAHPGIVDIVETTARRFEGDAMLLAMGGFHLRSEPRPEHIVERFRQLGVKHVGPSHCSGVETREAFARHYGDDHVEVGVGACVRPGDCSASG
jgi:7,8-dihydropterin-6-yl-methyl-4-(beta-D-ribofuranosyl)aminobenzene 5'-phosphate synthase